MSTRNPGLQRRTDSDMAHIQRERLHPKKGMSLQITHSSEAVTALCIINHHVFAGIGSSLYVYETRRGICVHRCVVLPCQKIHGIVPDPLDTNILSIHGGKSIHVMRQSIEDLRYETVSLSPVRENEDWIWNICWLTRDEESSTIALALGHNVILHWDWNRDVILHRIRCVEKCILYSATFIGNRWENLVLAAGTVFNQVVLWSPSENSSGANNSPVLFRLTGHQGVIFSIAYNVVLKWLCSVSDDRSIRIWQLKFQEQAVGANSGPSIRQWEGVTSELLHVLYGHDARVWDAKILSRNFVSIAEDATCCIWDHQGQVIKKFKGHKGKSIWSLAVSEDETFVVTGGGDTGILLWNLTEDDCHTPTSQQIFQLQDKEDFPRLVTLQDYDNILVMTNNGILCKYCVSKCSWQTLMSCSTFRSYTIMSLSPNGATITIGNITGEIRLIHQAAAKGQVTYIVHSKQIYSSGEKIFSIIWLSDWDILTTGPNGNILLWKMDFSASQLSLIQKASFILPVCKQHWVSAASFILEGQAIVCGDRGGTVHLYYVTGESVEEKPNQSFVKIHGKAGVTDVCCHGDYVYTTGRDGLYRIYNYEKGQLCLLNSNKAFKGLEWIARLRFNEENDLHIYGFHTSNFVLWSVNHGQKLIQLPCGGGHRAWGSHFSTDGDSFRFIYLKNKDLCLCESKLNTNQVILKPVLHGRKISDVKHISTMTDTGLPVTIYVTSSEDTSIIVSAINHNSRGVPEHIPLQRLQGHISSIRTLATCRYTQTDDIVHKVIMFSGGGRAQILAWKLTLKCPTRQKNFNSSDNSCTWKSRNCETYTEEANELNGASCASIDKCKQTHETLSVTTIGCQNVNMCSKSSGQTGSISVHESVKTFSTRSDYDVNKICLAENLGRYMLCQKHKRKKYKPWKENHGHSDPETRIMDLSAFPASDISKSCPDGICFLLAACSDGFLRLLAFSEEEREFSLILETGYHSNCVLQVDHIIHGEKDHPQVLVLSAATDGRIAVWNLTNQCQKFLNYYDEEPEDELCDGIKEDQSIEFNEVPITIFQAHQSGVNSLHISKLSENQYLIVSGGDDNSINISQLTLEINEIKGDNSKLTISVEQYVKKIDAHAAQVTGVHVLDSDLLLSTSIDQRVCLWKLPQADSHEQMEMLACQAVTVADISGMAIWSHRGRHQVAICGEGMALLEVENSTTS